MNPPPVPAQSRPAPHLQPGLPPRPHMPGRVCPPSGRQRPATAKPRRARNTTHAVQSPAPAGQVRSRFRDQRPFPWPPSCARCRSRRATARRIPADRPSKRRDVPPDRAAPAYVSGRIVPERDRQAVMIVSSRYASTASEGNRRSTRLWSCHCSVSIRAWRCSAISRTAAGMSCPRSACNNASSSKSCSANQALARAYSRATSSDAVSSL